jgi:tagatose 6-phosphate kinase
VILAVCPNPAVDTFAWVDSLEAGGVHRVRRERRFPGGKGVHVALALSELGEEVVLLGFWGGATGAWIKARCEGAGIECVGPELAGWSRQCFTFKTPDEGETEILGMGPEVTTTDLERFSKAFASRVRGSRAVTLSGSLPQGAPPGLCSELIELAREAGARTFVDCTGEALASALARSPFGLHLNLREGRALTGESDPAQMARRIPRDVEIAALTAGEDGLFLRTKGKLLHANVRVEKVLSAVGSGDCLLAGLAAGWARGHDDDSMARLAVACGAANCLREELGMLHRSDVEGLLPLVEARPLEERA